MEERREKSIEVQVSKDGLEAYIKLCPGEGETYTVEQLVEALGAKKVVYGIDHIELQNIIKEKRYFEEVLVAKGTLPEDGKDGYYEFLFETDVTRNLTLAAFSQMFSASTPLYLIGRIAVLFESQPNYAGRASMVAMQVIGLVYMVIVFSAGMYLEKKRTKE